ncbi:CDP-diacylglycerol--serine O-phosphatidyltransferase [Massilia antarctica]|uniref:CDP-diacylglycerol--serine O-phosphatidyltransferase n=1 Tax=Massilia antarctica TaxID=2765360 RepID=UPI0006BB9130|nr:CDP-diacylglycerol--serine O-phosphatidyltransferase [Massilia sp. H27-R4]MCY0913828.1 CDP-diacylglycerol--serine O-phosphatidyltransferase [Massilia sp. H27-R4]CUI04444.1 CDP-diacylglycerol--serine O-phosphatidyltransferase [Janthinobacterium sp. CG23_2]CUU28230.1 CDP-diacylglycerol--serine O-phosphatidyltransferase [Janthinobacterium sp. CG23_2]
MATFPRRRKPSVPKAKGGKLSRFSKIGRRVDADGNPMRRRGIYLLPNAFTTAALFCGFYAIVMAMNQRFEHAGWAIFIAMILDGLDGRIARLTNTQSEFGAQYDSLADMVSFGAAPALVIYEWSLRGLGKFGWLAAFVYCAGAALRLARFNTNIEVVDKRFFQGLPSPAAAAMVAGFVLMMSDLGFSGAELPWFSWGIALFAGLTMVTNVPFYSFKDVNFRKSVPFIAVFLIALALALVSIDPPKVLMPLFVIYGLSGYAVYAWRLAKGKPVSIVQTDDQPLDPSERR